MHGEPKAEATTDLRSVLPLRAARAEATADATDFCSVLLLRAFESADVGLLEAAVCFVCDRIADTASNVSLVFVLVPTSSMYGLAVCLLIFSCLCFVVLELRILTVDVPAHLCTYFAVVVLPRNVRIVGLLKSPSPVGSYNHSCGLVSAYIKQPT